MVTSASIAFKKQSRPLLVYILGWGRSGSSIMANILGSMPESASLGEVRYLWDRGILENGICGCGEPFAECDFWPGLSVAGGRLGDISPDRASSLVKSIGSGARRSQIPALQSDRTRRSYLERNSADLDLLMELYASAFEKSESRVLVDASKSPFYALNFLHEDRPFDVAFLHLVRDPRAVLYSWKKTKQRGDSSDDQLFPKYSSMRSLIQWALVNSRCERFAKLAPGSYFQVRYEDFADNWPAALVSGADGLFETTQDGILPENGRTATVHAQHSISGNPSRFNLGEVTLKPDTSWNGAVTGMDRKLAAMICGPVAGRYGYSMGG
ncbi:MAG: sulfotransferase family protein [Roseobacter sp.]